MSVNTERSLIGPRVRAISEEALCGVIQDIDRLSASLEHRSVVDDAFFEIEKIRRLYLSNLGKASGDSLCAQTDSISPGNGVCDTSDSTSLPDPSTTTQTEFSQHSPIHNTNLQNSKRCYAAALTSGKDRPTITATSNNNTAVNVRETRLPVSTTRAAAPCSARTLRVSPVQNSSSGYRNRNRNNSKTSVQDRMQQLGSDAGHAQCHVRHPALTSVGPKRAHPYQIDVVFVARDCDESPAKVKQQVTKPERYNRIKLAKNEEDFCLETAPKNSQRGVSSSTDTNPENLSPKLSSSALADIFLDTRQGRGLSTETSVCFNDPDVVNISGKDSVCTVGDILLPETVGQTKSSASDPDEDAFTDNGNAQRSDEATGALLPSSCCLRSS